MLLLYVLGVTCVLFVDSAKILAVFPTPSISHQVLFRPITQELARRGHELVVITTDPAFTKGQTPKNLTEIDVHDVSYKIWTEAFLATSTGKKNELYNQIQVGIDLLLKIFLKQTEQPEVKKIIHSNDTFDLIFIEACVRPALLFSHLFKAPIIQISSFGGFVGNFETVGAPNHPLLNPLSMRQRIFNLTLWEKISELYNWYVLERMVEQQEKVEDAALQKEFGNDVPPLSELRKNVDMLFLNMHPIWDGNRPTPPSVLYMGGVHQRVKKALPKDLQTYLNSSKHGVIYVSFGTNCDPALAAPQKIQAMVAALSQLPYDVLWKWNTDEMPGRTPNIKISKWFPQSDLLRHPKIKLFITQAGLQSTDEAILAGVPLLSIPMLGDQWFNAEKYVQLGIGLKLDMETLTAEKLKHSIETIINDDSYRRNVAKFRTLMQDQPQTPLDRVIWWTEHVIRHKGGAHLRSPTANMSWAEYLELELVLILLAVLLPALILVAFVVYKSLEYLPILRIRKSKQN